MLVNSILLLLNSGETSNIFDNGFLVLPRWQVQDIDTEEDWRRAEIPSIA